MKKRYKYALIFLFIHIFILVFSDSGLIHLKLSQATSGGLADLLWMFAFPFESPLFFIGRHPCLESFVGSDQGHFIFWYIVGPLFYFLVGFIIGYLREPQQIKTNKTQKVKEK